MRTAKLISQKVYAAIFILLLCSQLFGQSQPSASRFTNYGTAAMKMKPPANLLPPPTAADRMRFQQQATFGYSPALDAYIASLPNGFEQYLDEQMATSIAPPHFFPDYVDTSHDYSIKPVMPFANCNGTNLIGPPDVPDSPTNCFRDTYTMYPLQQWFFKEALYGSAQLRHRVAWALSQVWVTSANELKQSRHMAEYYKILYTYALGDDNISGTPALLDDSYLGLMKAMTLNPAMGEYLDMAYSEKERTIPNTNTVIKPNENYPRELLQLFTTGVNELVVVNPDPVGDPTFNSYGTEKLVSGKPVPVYNQAKINEFARVFTGWTFCNTYVSTTVCPNARLGSMNFIDPMKFISTNHDNLSKTLLSYSGAVHTSIPANLTGDDELTRALQNIFNHPNVPPFISKHLIQHLVTSNPSPQYLKRVADKFVNDGTGKRGNMKAVIKAILLDTEARGDSKSDPFGKLREPVQFTTNILRAFNVKGAGTAESDGVVFKDANFLKMNQRPFYSPSVFNYYSPKNAAILNGNVITYNGVGLLAPEFGLFTPTTAVSRANFAFGIVFTGISPNFPDITDGTSLNISDIESIYYGAPNEGKARAAVIDELNRRLLNNTMPPYMESAIQNSMIAISHSNPTGRIKAAIYLVVTSAEFQVQR